MLPKNWNHDRRVTEAYTKRQVALMKRFHIHFKQWEQTVCGFRRGGLPPKEALHRANAQFVKYLIRKANIPASLQWRGRPHPFDQNCLVCDLLAELSVIKTPGRLRYLGNFYAGKEKVAQCRYEEDVEICEDVEFPNYLDAWRCEVCGNEFTDGY